MRFVYILTRWSGRKEDVPVILRVVGSPFAAGPSKQMRGGEQDSIPQCDIEFEGAGQRGRDLH